jgi:hypothetical protein
MPLLADDRPHLGWKIYAVVMVIATVASLPEMKLEPVALAEMAINGVALFGLFGFAWKIRAPGPPLFWRVVALLTVAMIFVNIAMVVMKAGANPQRVALAGAVVFVVAFSAPTSLALFRYARWLEARELR